MSEVIERYRGLAEQFGARVEATPDDKWSAPAPCDEWTARDVVAHIVGAQRRVTAGITGASAEEVPADADPKQLWRDANAALADALKQPGVLEKSVPSPMGDMTLELVMGRLMAADILIHTWDLARAVGGDERLDEDAVAHTLDGLRPMDAMLRRPGAFGPKIEPPENADLQTELLCFVGRRP